MPADIHKRRNRTRIYLFAKYLVKFSRSVTLLSLLFDKNAMCYGYRITYERSGVGKRHG